MKILKLEERTTNIMIIIEFNARITKIMKIIEFHVRKIKIPNKSKVILQNNENHENIMIPYDNHENH